MAASVKRERSGSIDESENLSPDYVPVRRRPTRQPSSSTEPSLPRVKSDESETTLPEASTSIRQPTPVEWPLPSVERKKLDHERKAEQQTTKQETLDAEAQACRMEEETRKVKRELEQDCEPDDRYEYPDRGCEESQRHVYDFHPRTQTLPLPRHRPPLQPLEPLPVAPWPHRETTRREVAHNHGGTAFLNTVENSGPFVHSAKYGFGVDWHDGRKRGQSVFYDERPYRPHNQSRYYHERYSRLPEPSWEHPHKDREPYRPRSPPCPPYDYHGDRQEKVFQQYAPQQDSPQSHVPRREEQEQQQRRQPEQPYSHYSLQYEQSQGEQQPESRPDLLLSQPFQPPERGYDGRYTRPRTPLSHVQEEEEKHASYSEETESRKRKADNNTDHRDKRTRTGHERTEPTLQPGPSRRWPLAGSARQQNHSTRELRPNDNVIRFGLDVWFHGPRSTTGPLTSDGLASSFDNTATLSGGGSFTFTSTALPSETTAIASSPNTEEAPNTATTTATVATAVTSAVTAAITTVTSRRGSGHRRDRNHSRGRSRDNSNHSTTTPSAEDRAARRARLLQEQRDQLRRVNEQQIQGYDEVVRRQTMWHVAHEAEQLQRLQGWRWQHDPALAAQGVILPPLHAPLQPPPQFRADSGTPQVGYTLPPPTMTMAPSMMAPADLLLSSHIPRPVPYHISPSVPIQNNVAASNNAFGETLVQQNSFVGNTQPADMSTMRYIPNMAPDQLQYPFGEIPGPDTSERPNSWSMTGQDDNQPLMSPPQAGQPTQSPQSPETPQFYNTAGEYTHHPNRSLLGTARPSWTAVQENRFGEDGQSSVGYESICYCNDCCGQGGRYGEGGTSR